jgi:acyl-CoA synthetase (AMP-forming)/AMP-acid ligase II
LPPRLKQRFFERLGAKLLHLYGPTEAAISVTGWECVPGTESGAVVPLGRPMANVQIYLLDRAGRPVPPGVPGEIYVGGIAVARGYLKRPELTRERFVRDHFRRSTPARLLYRTGDLARFRADGLIEFIGRIDQQVKIGGARVEPREIEVALNAHPRIKRAAVRAQQDGRGDVRLIAYMVIEGGEPPSVFSLREHCLAHLPSFMVPAAFCFLEEMPLLTNGKVDYSSLQPLETPA